MKNSKQNELLRILSKAEQSIPSATLAGMLGISERTVRNYVKELNESGNVTILSSREGYSLQEGESGWENSTPENEVRAWHVLADLLTGKDGINAFDEAERLFVSASTVVNVIIPQIKGFIKEYGLRIESRNYQFYLVGSEQSKRRLIGHIATSESYGFFSTEEALEQLFPEQNIDVIMQELYDTCQKAKIYLNDYSMNNLLVHILIILIRLRSDDILEEKKHHISSNHFLESLNNREEILALADMISDNYMKNYGIRIPNRDYQQILILIALSVEHEVVDIQSFVSQEFIRNVASVLSMVSERYDTPEFDSDFVLRFSVHAFYAYQRCIYQIGYPNPVGLQLKQDYAPVYDMAVFFVHKFSDLYKVTFSEDEIAFIAFHFGAFLENSKKSRELITCVIVAETYHGFSKRLAGEINGAFEGRILVKDVLPISRYMRYTPSCDLVISTLPIRNAGCRMVQVSPIITKQNLDSIREKLDEIDGERELVNARMFLRSLFHRELYFRNIALPDERAYIEFMGRHCMENGYVKEAFIQDVLLRENVSSTAFVDALAVPHAINQYAEKSFICVVHNSTPIRWGRKSIHFILMIGITRQEMKYFKSAFELIIELFNTTSRTIELLRTDSFEEFCSCMK